MLKVYWKVIDRTESLRQGRHSEKGHRHEECSFHPWGTCLTEWGIVHPWLCFFTCFPATCLLCFGCHGDCVSQVKVWILSFLSILVLCIYSPLCKPLQQQQNLNDLDRFSLCLFSCFMPSYQLSKWKRVWKMIKAIFQNVRQFIEWLGCASLKKQRIACGLKAAHVNGNSVCFSWFKDRNYKYSITKVITDTQEISLQMCSKYPFSCRCPSSNDIWLSWKTSRMQCLWN